MRVQVLLNALAIILVAAPTAPALAGSSSCSDSAHVSWRADESFTRIRGAVVSVPGCDGGETVGLQLLTTQGGVPRAPLLASAEADEARFDLEPYGLRIEPLTGVRVFLNGRPVPVGRNGPTAQEPGGGADRPSTPPPGRGVDGVRAERPAVPSPEAGVGGVRTERPAALSPGGIGQETPGAQPAPIPAPSTDNEGHLLALPTTGAAVATLFALAVAALLVGGLLRRFRYRDS